MRKIKIYILVQKKEKTKHVTARDINDMDKKNNANNMQNVNIYANAKQHRNEWTMHSQAKLCVCVCALYTTSEQLTSI